MAHTIAELKKLVRDIVEGQVYTSRVTPTENLTMVWMPVLCMEKEAYEELREKLGAKGFMYEYLNKSLPRSINGCPIFPSFSYVTSEEAEWIDERYEAVQKALGATLEDPEAVPAVPEDKNSPEMP